MIAFVQENMAPDSICAQALLTNSKYGNGVGNFVSKCKCTLYKLDDVFIVMAKLLA